MQETFICCKQDFPVFVCTLPARHVLSVDNLLEMYRLLLNSLACLPWSLPVYNVSCLLHNNVQQPGVSLSAAKQLWLPFPAAVKACLSCSFSSSGVWSSKDQACLVCSFTALWILSPAYQSNQLTSSVCLCLQPGGVTCFVYS
jgi:hypothetical protein